MKLATLMCITLLGSCGATIDQETANEINSKLRCISIYDHEAQVDRRRITEEIRRENNEHGTCVRVLAQLKTAGETLREQSWDICDSGYARKRIPRTMTIMETSKVECRYDKGVRDYDTHNFCSKLVNGSFMFNAPSTGKYEVFGEKRREIKLSAGNVYLLDGSTFRVRKIK